MAEPSAAHTERVYVTPKMWRKNDDEPDEECALCGQTASRMIPAPICASCAFQLYRFMDQSMYGSAPRDPLSTVRNRPSLSTVYYVRFADRIKIGVTSNMRNRMASLRPDEVLAVEPGDWALEQQRHAQFRDCRRSARGEWYHDTPELRDHIASVVAQHGPPPPIH